MKKAILLTLLSAISYFHGFSLPVSGCVTKNKTEATKLLLDKNEAIGQSFTACADGFLSHFSFKTSDLASNESKAYINFYEVINNQFKLLHQENEFLPKMLNAGEQTFWISKRIPVYEGREYAVEILNISEESFSVNYSEVDSYIFGSMIVNGMFTYSDLDFSVGIKSEYQRTKHAVQKINSTPKKLEGENLLFQSWSNKSLEIQYGDVGQSFQVKESRDVQQLAVKIKNAKTKSSGLVEIFEDGLDLKHKVISQEINFVAERGERWEMITFKERINLTPEKTYFISFKFDDGSANSKFYYSTADAYKNGDMFIGDLLLKECDLSFFLQSKGENYLQEIKWLEENEYENIDASPLTKLTDARNDFKIQTFPNPFDQQFMISYENMKANKPVTVAITNLSGTLLWKETYRIESEKGTINVYPEINLASGKYNITVIQEDQRKMSTIISR